MILDQQVTELFYEIPKSVADGSLDKCIRRYERQLRRYEAELSNRGEYFGGNKLLNFCIFKFLMLNNLVHPTYGRAISKIEFGIRKKPREIIFQTYKLKV